MTARKRRGRSDEVETASCGALASRFLSSFFHHGHYRTVLLSPSDLDRHHVDVMARVHARVIVDLGGACHAASGASHDHQTGCRPSDAWPCGRSSPSRTSQRPEGPRRPRTARPSPTRRARRRCLSGSWRGGRSRRTFSGATAAVKKNGTAVRGPIDRQIRTCHAVTVNSALAVTVTLLLRRPSH